jgi:phage shock protein E
MLVVVIKAMPCMGTNAKHHCIALYKIFAFAYRMKRIIALAITFSTLPLFADEKPAKPAAEEKQINSKHLTVDETEKLIASTPGLIIIDVRIPEEFDHEHIKGAINVNVFDEAFEKILGKLDQTKPVLVHCASGRRSSRALEQMAGKVKFPTIYHMKDGFNAWKKAGKPFESNPLPSQKKPGSN